MNELWDTLVSAPLNVVVSFAIIGFVASALLWCVGKVMQWFGKDPPWFD